MGLSDEVARLEEENARLKEALALMVRALRDAAPLLENQPVPQPPPDTAPVAQPPPPDTTVPPSMSAQQDGAYRVDVSEFVPVGGDPHYTTHEY